MAARFEIVGNALVVTDTVSGNIIIDPPRGAVWYNSDKLNQSEPEVVVYWLNSANPKALELFTRPLSQTQNDAGVTFTAATFRSFAHANLGNRTGGGNGNGVARTTVNIGSFNDFEGLETFAAANLNQLHNSTTQVTRATVTGVAVYEWGGEDTPAAYNNRWFVIAQLNTITAGERTNLNRSLFNVGLAGQVMTFTRNDNSTITITLPSAGTRPVVPMPDLPEGRIFALQEEVDNWDATTPFPTILDNGEAVQAGYVFEIDVPGTRDGQTFTTDDLLLAVTDNPNADTFADNWHKISGGALVGVHSWGGFTGAVDDRMIQTVLNRLGYLRSVEVQSNGQTVLGEIKGFNFSEGLDVSVSEGIATIVVTAGGGREPSPNPLYIGFSSSQDATSLDVNTAFSSTNLRGTFTIPTFEGNMYLLILQPQSDTEYSQIKIDDINQKGAFTVTDNARNITVPYRLYVSENLLIGSVVSGESIELI